MTTSLSPSPWRSQPLQTGYPTMGNNNFSYSRDNWRLDWSPCPRRGVRGGGGGGGVAMATRLILVTFEAPYQLLNRSLRTRRGCLATVPPETYGNVTETTGYHCTPEALPPPPPIPPLKVLLVFGYRGVSLMTWLNTWLCFTDHVRRPQKGREKTNNAEMVYLHSARRVSRGRYIKKYRGPPAKMCSQGSLREATRVSALS